MRVRMRDIVPVWLLKQFCQRRGNRRTPSIDTTPFTVYDPILSDIATLASDWHGAGTCEPASLRAMALYGQHRRIRHSAETGVGKSTLLLSHMSDHHTVFARDDTGLHNSLVNVRTSPLLKRETV